MKEKRRQKSASSIVSDDYCLERLFDPEDLYYTPMNELLKCYKKRNLIPGRIYNLAKKYGNVPTTRDRIINAPQMERAGQRVYGHENFYYPPPKVYYCTKPNEHNLNQNLVNASDKEIITECEGDETDDEDNELKLTYKEMLNNRKTMRNNLNKLDFDIEYLKRKKDLTEVEKRVLNKILYIEKEVQTDPIIEKQGDRNKSPFPKIQYPTPGAMERIEKFLNENRWRLVDLFKNIDKSKDWHLNREELIRECRRGHLDINGSMVDELIMVLGNSKNFTINYKALSKGRTSHLSERRAQLRESNQSFRTSEEEIDSDHEDAQIQSLNINSAKNINRLRRTDSISKPFHADPTTKIVLSSIEANIPSISTSTNQTPSLPSTASSPHYLTLPKLDLRPERYVPKESSPTLLVKDEGISACSSSLKAMSPINLKNSNVQNNSNSLLHNTRQSLSNLREKQELEYEICLERIKNLDIVKSASTLRMGYLNPPDANRDEILARLKEKEDKKKQLARKKLKEVIRKRKKANET